MKNEFAERLNQNLKPEALELVKTAAQIADRHKMPIYLVGGIVRDLILGRPGFDIDIVAAGDVLPLAERLAQSFKTRVISRSKFGTAKLEISGITVDLVTARREIYKKPGFLPTVIFPGSIEEDLFRRDFTVNAMALRADLSGFGALLDPYKGLEDIENGIIRILHDRSFVDDATRIFRAVRYEQRLEFRIEINTLQSLRQNIKMIDTVSPDRIKHELMLFLEEEQPEKPLCRAYELGILAKIHPSLSADNWITERFRAARQAAVVRPGLLYLCLLVYRLDQSELKELLERFNFTRTQADAMNHTLSLKTEIAGNPNAGMSKLQAYRLLNRFTPVSLYANLIASDSQPAKDALELYLSELRYVKSCLTGKDLIAMGIPAGPKVGQYLEKILEGRLSGDLKSRKDEELFVRKLANY
jgi:tRNA nucleotidyltransferase (CCA-adding enzyme)